MRSAFFENMAAAAKALTARRECYQIPPVHSRKPRRSKNGTPGKDPVAKAAVAAAARSDGTVIDLVRREVEPDGVMTIDEIVTSNAFRRSGNLLLNSCG